MSRWLYKLCHKQLHHAGLQLLSLLGQNCSPKQFAESRLHWHQLFVWVFCCTLERSCSHSIPISQQIFTFGAEHSLLKSLILYQILSSHKTLYWGLELCNEWGGRQDHQQPFPLQGEGGRRVVSLFWNGQEESQYGNGQKDTLLGQKLYSLGLTLWGKVLLIGGFWRRGWCRSYW